MATTRVENGNFSHDFGKANGDIEPGVKAKKQRSRIRWTIGLVVRLFIWYTLVSPLLRCPSRVEELKESSPRVCKPYIIVRSHIEPHIRPYYNVYGAPYVELARPYVQVLNERVCSPVVKVAKQGYDKYGAPALEQAEVYGREQWETQVVPRLQSAQESLNDIYKATVDPYVQRAVAGVSPYYRHISNRISKIYGEYVQFFYFQYGPFIGKTYTSGQDMLTTTVFPYAGGAWSSVVRFVNGTLWPMVTGLYSENVEPQLVKIGRKLASYREGKRLRGVADEVDSLSETPAPSITVIAVSTEAAQTPGSATPTPTQETSTTTSAFSSREQAEQTRGKTASDLQTWQKKFAIAADKGVEDLRERVNDIVESVITSGALSNGASLVTTLETVIEDELFTIKRQIDVSVESLPLEGAPGDEDKAEEEVMKAIRQAAISVRDRAHSLREWYNSFDKELVRRVSVAVDSTLEVLDSVRDLGLQEIGMRWARMDGISYKDWARYHALKEQLDDWRVEVSNRGMEHEKLEEARALAGEFLDQGMKIAEAAAKELARLRDVGKWKIAAREVSDNFDTRSEPPSVPSKPINESDPASDENVSVLGTTTEDSHIIVAEKFFSGVEGAIDGVENDELVSTEYQPLNSDQRILRVDDEESSGKKSTPVPSGSITFTKESLDSEDVPSQVPDKAAWGGVAAEAIPEHSRFQDRLEEDKGNEFPEQLHSLVSQASDNYAEAAKAVNEALLGPSPPHGLSENAAAASSVIYDTQPPPLQSLMSEAKSVLSSPMPTPIPSMTRPVDYVSSMASSKLSEGLSLASAQFAQVQATVSPGDQILLDARRRYYEAIGLAHDHYSAFLSSASQAVYGSTPMPPPRNSRNIIEDASNQVVENWEGFVSKASEQVYGTEPGYFEGARTAIEGAFSSAESAISNAVYSTETGHPSSAGSAMSSDLSHAQPEASTAIHEQQGAFESTTSKLSVGVESAQTRLAGLASSASDFASEAVWTAASHVEDVSGSAKSAAYGTKDEL